MSQSTINAKGQTTVPAEIRAHMKSKPGTRLAWTILSDGTVIVRSKTKTLGDLAGILKAPEGVHVTIEEMRR